MEKNMSNEYKRTANNGDVEKLVEARSSLMTAIRDVVAHALNLESSTSPYTGKHLSDEAIPAIDVLCDTVRTCATREADMHVSCLVAAIETYPIEGVNTFVEVERRRARKYLEGKLCKKTSRMTKEYKCKLGHITHEGARRLRVSATVESGHICWTCIALFLKENFAAVEVLQTTSGGDT
jgi:hypothetical protein